jgi:hypothetical protein
VLQLPGVCTTLRIRSGLVKAGEPQFTIGVVAEDAPTARSSG